MLCLDGRPCPLPHGPGPLHLPSRPRACIALQVSSITSRERLSRPHARLVGPERADLRAAAHPPAACCPRLLRGADPGAPAGSRPPPRGCTYLAVVGACVPEPPAQAANAVQHQAPDQVVLQGPVGGRGAGRGQASAVCSPSREVRVVGKTSRTAPPTHPGTVGTVRLPPDARGASEERLQGPLANMRFSMSFGPRSRCSVVSPWEGALLGRGQSRGKDASCHLPGASPG